jgi:ketosteroid isomerase-like protein
MKKTTFLLFIIVYAGLLHAQEPLTKHQLTAQQTIVNMFDALSNRDSSSLRAYCTADIALYEYGQVWNLDTLILIAITQNHATDFHRINHFDFIKTTTDKKIAWVTYRLHSVITRDGKQGTSQWMETVVLVKEKKRWKIRVLHSTLLKRT